MRFGVFYTEAKSVKGESSLILALRNAEHLITPVMVSQEQHYLGKKGNTERHIEQRVQEIMPKGSFQMEEKNNRFHLHGRNIDALIQEHFNDFFYRGKISNTDWINLKWEQPFAGFDVEDPLLPIILGYESLQSDVREFFSKHALPLLAENDKKKLEPRQVYKLFRSLKKAPEGSRPDLEKILERTAALNGELTQLNPQHSMTFNPEIIAAELFLADEAHMRRVRLDPEEFPLRVGSFDIEVADYWKNAPRIYLIGVMSPNGDVVHTRYGFEPPVLVEDGRRAEIRVHPDEHQLRFASSTDLNGLTVVATQNGLGYDYPKTAKDDGVFRVAANSDPIKQRYHVGIFERNRNPAAIDVDLMNVGRNYFSRFLPDFKLETILEFIDKFFPGANFNFAKMHSYKQINTLEEIANADKQAAKDLALYNLRDTLATGAAVQLLWPIISKIAQVTQSSFFSAANDTRSKLAHNYWARRQFEKEMHARDSWDEKFYEEFDVNHEIKRPKKKGEQKHGINKDFQREKDGILEKMITGREIGFSASQGKIDDVSVFFVPSLPFAFRHILDAEDSIKNLFWEADQSQNPVEKIMYYELADYLAREPLKDLRMAQKVKGQGYDGKYYRKYGISYEESHTRCQETLNRLFRPLRGMSVVNYSDNIIFVRAVDGAARQKLVDAGMLYLGTGDILSLEKSRVVYKLTDSIFTTGIRIPSKKQRHDPDPEKGLMSNLELKLLRDFVELRFTDERKALELVAQTAADVRANRVEPLEYLSELRVHEVNENADPQQQQRERAKIKAYFKPNVGDTILFVRVVPEFVLGEKDPVGLWARYDPETKSFDRTPKIDTNHYHKKVFLEGSKLWSMLSRLYSDAEGINQLCYGEPRAANRLSAGEFTLV